MVFTGGAWSPDGPERDKAGTAWRAKIGEWQRGRFLPAA